MSILKASNRVLKWGQRRIQRGNPPQAARRGRGEPGEAVPRLNRGSEQLLDSLRGQEPALIGGDTNYHGIHNSK